MINLALWFGEGFYILVNLHANSFTLRHVYKYLYVDALQEWLNQVEK